MTFVGNYPQPEPLRGRIEETALAGEVACLEALLRGADLDDAAHRRAQERARTLVEEVRRRGKSPWGIDAFLQEYGLTNREGVLLMCIAEALLRVPDPDTATRLIRDKIGDADWERHMGHSDSLLVNASSWGLMLTGRIFDMSQTKVEGAASALRQLISNSGEPVIRQAVTQAMRILGRQFVMGRTIEEALERATELEAKGYRFSYDMLGEAAQTMADARRYFEDYSHAIDAVGAGAGGRDVIEAPGISVKLSALHPRYELGHKERMMRELVPVVKELALKARAHDMGFCIDAEEADRLDLSLDLVEAVFTDPDLEGWEGFGLAVQAYQKRGYLVLDWLADLARRQGRRMMVRLVKGAYWDTEIKRAQEQGLSGYPVFTRKASTDVSYLGCARKLLSSRDALYPQFATHNAHTVATIAEMAGNDRAFEFQRLHGMGEPLHDQIIDKGGLDLSSRTYAPVGSHEDLLAYLVRRLLENGANTSFVNRINDAKLPIDEIIADPVGRVRGMTQKPHPRIPLPVNLYGAERKNSRGIDQGNPMELRQLAQSMADADRSWAAAPIISGERLDGEPPRSLMEPADNRQPVGTVSAATKEMVETALAAADKAAPGWDRTPADERAACLQRAADLLESHMAEFVVLCAREGGKTIDDSIAEIREAADFCRYYGLRARTDFDHPHPMPGPTGELNQVSLHGRGVFGCISPWNFPMAIFTGQVTAALAAGNAVIAKPAGQTPMVASRVVELLHQAGIPGDVLHFLPGSGAVIGGAMSSDPRIAGIAFTGSEVTGRAINQALAARPGALSPLIAETGGQNAMIVDSTALPEQVVEDVLVSAFGSAGQRCSCLRVLFIQQDVAEKTIEMLTGAMEELVVGDPRYLATDVGPVIDASARDELDDHARFMEKEAKLLYQVPLSADCAHGSFFAPRAFKLETLDILTEEVFGPILHVLTYDGNRLDDVIETVNNTGYGLTLGIHTRVDATARYIHQRLKVGNAYVNRNMVGAVVGVQPFGGEGLSGTGPKAGGPRYMYRFAVERTLSINTTASGGNAALMTMSDEELV